MEPAGILKLFQRSLQYKIRYLNFISDGDSKTFATLSEAKPYGDEHPVEKKDCVGHVQKRLGTALRNLKTIHRGQKLADGKTIGGKGRLTDKLIDTLQNYYGLAIRNNKGDIKGMMKAVQASLLHNNSTDEHPRHHLCPSGADSWCKYNKAKALGKEYHHQKDPIPEAVLTLMKPIYSRLGSRDLLEKCLGGYTQNANEAIHQLVWKFCPKVLFLGAAAVKCGAALAVCHYNDGVSSFYHFASLFGCQPDDQGLKVLVGKDKRRIARSVYKNSQKAKNLRKQCRKRRKGLDDKKEEEGPMYAPGMDGLENLGEPSSKRPKNS